MLPFEHNGYGQDDEWVAANFTNALEILETGYPQWVDNQLTEGGEFVLDCDAASGLALRTQSGGSVALPLEWSAYYNEDSDSSYIVTASDINAVGTRTFTLTFTPDAGGEPIVRQIEVDVVKIHVEAEADWPSNKVRHVFGPGEKYVVYSGAGDLLLSTSAHADAGDRDVVFAVNDDFAMIEIKTIPPNNVIEYEFVREMTDDDWISPPISKTPLTSLVPGAGYMARRRLQPLYVNFSNIVIKEGFAPMWDQEGCFTNVVLFPPSVYCHNADAGAELVSEVEEGNYIEYYDKIGVQFGVIPTYSGSYSLPIPVYWGVSSGTCTNYFTTISQQVSVTPVLCDDCGAYLDTTVSKGGTSFTRRCPDED